jgi:hypothetical protein
MIIRRILNQFHAVVRCGLRTVGNTMSRLTKPISHSPALGTITDVVRSKPELVAENLLLRQQRIVLKRSVKRPPLTQTDRALCWLRVSSGFVSCLDNARSQYRSCHPRSVPPASRNMAHDDA